MEGPAQQPQQRKRTRTKRPKEPSSQQQHGGQGEEGGAPLTAEQRKRRARHQIWDLEDEIARNLETIEELERQNKQLQLKQELMAKTVTVRERQVQMLKRFGVGEDASTSHLMRLASTAAHTGLGPQQQHPQQLLQLQQAPSSASPSAPYPAQAATSCDSDSGAVGGPGAARAAAAAPSTISGDAGLMMWQQGRRQEGQPHLAAAPGLPLATAASSECGGETVDGPGRPGAFVAAPPAPPIAPRMDFPWLTPMHHQHANNNTHTSAPQGSDCNTGTNRSQSMASTYDRTTSTTTNLTGATSSATTNLTSTHNHHHHTSGARHHGQNPHAMGAPRSRPSSFVAAPLDPATTAAAARACGNFLAKMLAGVAQQLTGSGASCAQAMPFAAANNLNNSNGIMLNGGANGFGNAAACLFAGQNGRGGGGRCFDLDVEEEDEEEEDGGVYDLCGAGLGGGGGGPVSPFQAACRALGGLVARCRPPGTAPTADGDILPLVMAAGAAGGTVQRDLERLMLLNEGQVLDLFKRASQELSQLLFMAEDVHSPGWAEAHQQVEAAVHALRTLGSLMKVCNPCMARVVSRPVSAGLDLAGDAHWDSVARALLLSPQQVQDVATLNEMRLQWLGRIQQEHMVVGRLLSEVMQGVEASHWKVSHAKAELSGAEMGAKLQRVVGSGRWVLVLVDDMLSSHVLTTIQVARWMVHSYPYVPDASALVEAICRVHPAAQQRATARPPMAAPAPAPAPLPRHDPLMSVYGGGGGGGAFGGAFGGYGGYGGGGMSAVGLAAALGRVRNG